VNRVQIRVGVTGQGLVRGLGKVWARSTGKVVFEIGYRPGALTSVTRRRRHGTAASEAGSYPTSVKRLKPYKLDDDHTMGTPLFITAGSAPTPTNKETNQLNRKSTNNISGLLTEWKVLPPLFLSLDLIQSPSLISSLILANGL
jgi:hypothetical protein